MLYKKITPCLLFQGQAQEAAEFYTSIFKKSKILDSTPFTTSFRIEGHDFVALNGPKASFTWAVSFYVTCKNQKEVDYYWSKLSSGGGEEQPCGWVKDKFGLSWQIIPDAWSVFVHYATFHMPIEPNGFYHYNALQQLSYFAVIFILAPLAMLSGMAMSPAIENRFHWLPKLFGNRQGARSVHFLVMLSYTFFFIIHVTMVIITGVVRNMNHITLGTDNPSNTTGLYIVIGIILFTIAFSVYAHWVSWNRPRWVQKTDAFINGNLWQNTIDKLKPSPYYKKEDISPFFWPNGKLPTSETWKELAKNKFKDYKLKIGGLVENPVELSLDELMKLGKEQNITMHHCIQGWTGVAEWGGLPIRAIVDLVKPHPSVTTVVFYSFGEGLYGGVYYDTHTLDNCLKPASILAWEMNYEPLTEVYGAPLRLRVENQLGYKMVKWIERIEFVESHKTVGKGYGGKNEDDEYFDLLASS